MILFSTKKYEYLKEKILQDNFFSRGELVEENFSDGEKYTRIESSFKNKHVAVLGGTITDEDIMDVFHLSCALVKLGAKTLNIIIPFYGYSTMERSVKSGEIVKAKTIARLLSMIPTAYQGNNILLIDLHKEGITHYFENSIHSINICTNELMINKIKEMKLRNFSIGSTDEGGSKRVRNIANELAVPALMVLKRRVQEDVFLEAVSDIGETETVIIIDDMIRSGSSVVQAMDAYSEKKKDLKFIVMATHGIFCSKGFEKLKNDKRIKKIIVSDSHPNSLNKDLDIMSTAEDIIKNIKELI